MMNKKTSLRSGLYLLLLLCQLSPPLYAQENLIYHNIVTDKQGNIIPWYSADPGKSYDHIIELTWNFWDSMRTDLNGLPYYMNHQVWREDANDARGLGGDQIQMALSSWQLLYAYSGNERVRQNMKFMADYYLTHALAPSTAAWPDIPYPYNCFIYSGNYDGDMVLGRNITQPDKAGSFGLELVHLYKMSSRNSFHVANTNLYLEYAIRIANTLAHHTVDGDENNSPLPFKVNAITGETGKLKNNYTDKGDAGLSSYTTNWAGTLELFLELREMNTGNVAEYEKASNKILSWMKQYPLKNNKWGPFFEDITGWSDTQINAVTFAKFMMDHQEFFPEWKTQVPAIFAWVYKTLGNDKWKKYGVIVVNEQTRYQTPGQSHSARQAAVELQYGSLTGDDTRKVNAIRQLSWATYMVDTDGKNRYPQDDHWLTDGYGDYVRHYLRAMAYAPELAPAANHVLYSSSIIQQADYAGHINRSLIPYVAEKDLAGVNIFYTTFDAGGQERIRLIKKPSRVLLEGKPMTEVSSPGQQGFTWDASRNVLSVYRTAGQAVTIFN